MSCEFQSRPTRRSLLRPSVHYAMNITYALVPKSGSLLERMKHMISCVLPSPTSVQSDSIFNFFYSLANK